MGCLALSYYEQGLFLSTAKAAQRPALRIEKAAQRCPKGNVKSCAGSYKFGFNGIEKVNEVAGIGNHYTALYEEYDTRIVYRWNTDPKPVAWESPYVMFRNNPITHVDPLLDYSRAGAWWRNAVNGGNGISYTKTTGEWGYEKGIEGGVAFRDGLSKSERQGKIDEFKQSHIYTDKFGWLDAPQATISEWKPNLMDKWGADKSFIGKTSYDWANGLFQLPQLATQSFTGGFYNLDGTSSPRGSKEQLGSFFNGATSFVPAGEASLGLTYLKKVNAAQFSHIFKGTTISTASPAVRGTLNRAMNTYLIPRWNNAVPTGSFIFNGIGVAEYGKEEQANKQ